jgi:hypothetical protein
MQMYRAARMEALLIEGAGVRGVEEDASWGRVLTEDAKARGDRCDVATFTATLSRHNRGASASGEVFVVVYPGGGC